MALFDSINFSKLGKTIEALKPHPDYTDEFGNSWKWDASLGAYSATKEAVITDARTVRPGAAAPGGKNPFKGILIAIGAFLVFVLLTRK